jgi:hypothetical protein
VLAFFVGGNTSSNNPKDGTVRSKMLRDGGGGWSDPTPFSLIYVLMEMVFMYSLPNRPQIPLR